MPKGALVTVRYGPYNSCGIVDHRTFRLEGLQAALRASGHRCVLQSTLEWNKVELVVNGECVYVCNINDLEFGGEGQLDQLCKAAVTAVKNAY
ncbi:UPF0728 protein C10orf53 homolog [Engraulis encrasicolus]|uniref:UPF0728 protein C10orf53 homolog n=1 Tax=Engraulis encrasicolus TaxID=184585 RepID=UPI002FD053AD